jgi:hypothetical protein
MLRRNRRLPRAAISSVVAGVPPASRREAADTAASAIHLHFPRNKSTDFAQYISDGLYDRRIFWSMSKSNRRKEITYVQH